MISNSFKFTGLKHKDFLLNFQTSIHIWLKVILCIPLLCVVTIGQSQDLIYQWAKPIGGAVATDQCVSIEMQIDNGNNLVFTGYFIGNADFDPGIGNTNSTSPSNNDIFISKYDSAGNFMWVKQIGNSLDNEPQSITLDSNNNIYIVGSYNDTLDFDPGPGISSLYSGNTNAYILKLDSNGNFLWVKELTCNWITQLNKIIVDQTGNTYIKGKYAGTTDFDPGLNNYSLSSTGGSWNEFILKLDSLGNFI